MLSPTGYLWGRHQTLWSAEGQCPSAVATGQGLTPRVVPAYVTSQGGRGMPRLEAFPNSPLKNLYS